MVSAARIDRLTAFITEYRLWRHIRRAEQTREVESYSVALELKGLKAKAMAARAHIGKLDAAYEAFNARAASHVSDVEGLARQLGYMSDDLSFATATLGNSVAASNEAGEATEPAKPPPVTFQAAVDPAIQQPPAPPQTAIASGGFTLTPTMVIPDGQPTMRGAVHNPDVQLIRS